MEKLKRIISGEEVQSSSDESEELKEDGKNQLEAVAMETEPAEEQVAINQQLVGCVLQYIFHNMPERKCVLHDITSQRCTVQIEGGSREKYLSLTTVFLAENSHNKLTVLP